MTIEPFLGILGSYVVDFIMLLMILPSPLTIAASLNSSQKYFAVTHDRIRKIMLTNSVQASLKKNARFPTHIYICHLLVQGWLAMSIRV